MTDGDKTISTFSPHRRRSLRRDTVLGTAGAAQPCRGRTDALIFFRIVVFLRPGRKGKKATLTEVFVTTCEFFDDRRSRIVFTDLKEAGLLYLTCFNV